MKKAKSWCLPTYSGTFNVMSLCQVLEEVAGANILNDAILEPRRESLRARRRRGAYAEVLDELDEGSDDSDLDDF